MKRNTGSWKILYKLAIIAISISTITSVVATAGMVFLIYGDLTRIYPPDPLVPKINKGAYDKAAALLKAKEGGGKIDLDAREVTFGLVEPFGE